MVLKPLIPRRPAGAEREREDDAGHESEPAENELAVLKLEICQRENTVQKQESRQKDIGPSHDYSPSAFE